MTIALVLFPCSDREMGLRWPRTVSCHSSWQAGKRLLFENTTAETGSMLHCLDHTQNHDHERRRDSLQKYCLTIHPSDNSPKLTHRRRMQTLHRNLIMFRAAQREWRNKFYFAHRWCQANDRYWYISSKKLIQARRSRWSRKTVPKITNLDQRILRQTDCSTLRKTQTCDIQ